VAVLLQFPLTDATLAAACVGLVRTKSVTASRAIDAMLMQTNLFPDNLATPFRCALAAREDAAKDDAGFFITPPVIILGGGDYTDPGSKFLILKIKRATEARRRREKPKRQKVKLSTPRSCRR
jgi:hypothetical protein